MTLDNQIRKIIIAGGGSAGWMTAAALSNSLQGNCEIILIESEAIGTVGVGEATIPPIRTFNATLNIDEREFIKSTQATFKLGIEFSGWARKEESYFHPFGQHGKPFDIVNVHQYWLKAYMEGQIEYGFDEHSMAWQLAKQNRFGRPLGDPRNVLSTFDYAFHFDAGLYAKFLRQYSEQRGVKRIEGKIVDVILEGESGFVESLKIDNGQLIEADLFVDCTGFRAILMEGALGVGFEDWSQWLLCDRAVTVGSQKLPDLPPYTNSTAHDAGWQWRIPLQHRTGNGYVYSSQFIDEEIAEQTLLSHLRTEQIGAPKHLKFKTGRRSKFWHKNVIAIGLSSGFLEPLESTSIHLIQAGISKLLALFPDKSFDPYVIKEYNRIACTETERIRDFLILHYKLTDRSDSELWNYCREMEIPDSLSYKIQHFKKYGRHIAREMDLFGVDSWLAVHIGQRNFPNAVDPLATLRGQNGLKWLGKLRNAMMSAASQQVTHSEFIQTHCAAPANN